MPLPTQLCISGWVVSGVGRCLGPISGFACAGEAQPRSGVLVSRVRPCAHFPCSRESWDPLHSPAAPGGDRRKAFSSFHPLHLMHDALLPRTPQALLSRIQAGLHSGTRAATLHTAYPGRHVEERGQAQGACRRSRPVRRLCWTSGGYPSALECHPPLMRLHRCGAHCGSEVRPAYTAYPTHPLASWHGTWRLPGLCGRRWGM